VTASRTLDVLLDVDGVLYPFPETFTPYAADQLGRQLELDTTRWEFYEEWGVDYDAFVDLVTRGVAARRLWWEGAPYADVPAAIGRLRGAGHRLHLVTARDITGRDAAMAATNHWLAEHDLRVESVNLAQDKTTVLAALGLDPSRCVAVDDGPQHVLAWEGAGVFAVVLDRWGTYRGDHRAARDLHAFADLVDDFARASRF
jgi:FMN phosphatase YigB (HAD superfamily)